MALPVNHIAMIVPSFDRIGGYERQAFSMSLAFKQRNLHPYIVSDNLGHLPTYQNLMGIEVYRFYPFGQRFTGGQEIYLRKLFAFDLAKNVDIVHCHAFTFLSGWALKIAQRLNIPSLIKVATEQDVIKFHQSYQLKIKGYVEGVNNILLATKYISLNDNISKELANLGVPDDKILAMPNGVDSERFKPLNAEDKEKIKIELSLQNFEKIILYVGRFEERKRVEDLIQAWGKVATSLPKHHLVLVGDGEELDTCKILTQKLQLRQRVSFVGAVSETEKYLQASDIFVFPSRLEGMPNVVLEAMSSGLPIITTRIPGISELIQHQQNGLLFNPLDVEALIALLQTLASQPALGPELGHQARETILKKYSFNVLAEKYQRIYQQLKKPNTK